MKNYIQPGNIINLTMPYVRLAGQGVLVGAIFGVCAADIANGAAGEAAVEGVFDITKAVGAISQGARVYWDDTAKNITTTNTSNYCVGFCVVAALSGDATVRIRLGRTAAAGT